MPGTAHDGDNRSIDPDLIPSAEIHENVELAPLTTIGLGGVARYYVRWCDPAAICSTLGWARDKGLPVQVLGGGSNILFADQTYQGVVAKVELRGLEITRAGGGVTVVAGAGERWDDLVLKSVEAGLGGIECLSGIPGLVGATPIQNVGAYGQEVKERIVAVDAIDRESFETTRFANADCQFGYRTSRFKTADRDRFVITAVTFRLADPGRPQLRYPELERCLREDFDLPAGARGREAMSTVRRAVLKLRRAKSMVVDETDENSRSMGSFFLNPVIDAAELAALRSRLDRDLPAFESPDGYKVPAAWLVERSGFARGYQRDGIRISANHALALVNCGGTSTAVRRLAKEIERAVFDLSGIRLEPEPVIVGTEPSDD